MKPKKLAKKPRPATVDPKYIRVPNICFSLTEKTDKREKRFKKERLRHGFDQSELWSLNSTIARFIYPRLKSFADNLCGCPGGLCYSEDGVEDIKVGMQRWKEILDKIVYSFEYYADEEKSFSSNISKAEVKKIDQGMKLFVEWFPNLWN